MAAVGLATDARSTPIELSTERGGANLGLEPSRIELDLSASSVAETGEDPANDPLESLLPSGDDSALARPRDARGNAASGARTDAPALSRGNAAPSPFLSALAQHQLDLARRQAEQGDFERAAANLERGLEIDPDAAEIRAELGMVLIPLGRFAEAERQLKRAIALGGRSANVHAALAQTASAQGRPADSIQHGRAALRLDPDLVFAANNLAWLLATCSDPDLRDPEEAIRLAQAALRSVPGEPPRILDTLAAGYAAAGRYGDAIATARRAEAMADERGLHELAREIREHLERYRAGSPVLES